MIYGAEEWKGTPLLIFEYLEGGTLLDSLSRGPISLEEVIDLGTQLADALDLVHGSGVLHRDIKPSNIGYTSDGVPKILDFGLAAILDRSREEGTLPAVLPSDPGLIAELAWGAEPDDEPDGHAATGWYTFVPVTGSAGRPSAASRPSICGA